MTGSHSGQDRPQRKRFYEKELLRAAPRLLSALDRCPVSASGGSLDREYWAWASKDFSNLDMQRGLFVLAYLHKTPFEGNIYCGSPALAQWISQGIGFWISRQSRHGAFDHLYPYENSWMAAAFTLADLVPTYELVKGCLDAGLRESFLECMTKAGQYLVDRDEEHGFISNHRAGAAAGLLELSAITGDTRFADRAWNLMRGVYERQSPEGWFLEYEGADPGYQTLDTHYQALFFLACGGDAQVLQHADRSLQFLSYFLHPDGSIGGEYGSRACPQFFPGGFEVFAPHLPVAEALAAQGVAGLASGASAGLADADTRNEVPLATSYALAHRAACETQAADPSPLPWEREFERLWPEAGFYVRSDARTYTVCGLSKGGVIKIFDKQKHEIVFSSCGFSGRLSNGTHITTHLWTTSPRVAAPGLAGDGETVLKSERTIAVSAPFFVFFPDRLMSPLKLVLFRIFNLTAGKSPAINAFIRKHIIIGRFLKRRKQIPVTLSRAFRFEGSTVSIGDEITLDPGLDVTELKEHGFFSTVYMASARYFRLQDLNQAWSGENLAPGIQSGTIRTSRTI